MQLIKYFINISIINQKPIMNSDRSQNSTFEEILMDYYLLLKFRIVKIYFMK